MSDLLFADARRRPDLFQPCRPSEGRAEGGLVSPVDEWLQSCKLNVPQDLVLVWQLYGAGADIFETETLLGPFGDPVYGNDVMGVNESLWARGMSHDYVVFHRGLGGLSAIRQSDLRYVQLREDTFREHGVYRTFDEWYREVPRAEYGARYGVADGTSPVRAKPTAKPT